MFLKDMQAFQDDLIELQAVEITLDINKIKVNLVELEKWLEDREEKALTVAELELLLPFFNIEEG